MSVKLKLGNLSTREIADITGGQLSTIGKGAQTEVESIITNSKEQGENFLFIAIIGEKFDGHEFIEEAISNGAIAILCQKIPSSLAQSSKYNCTFILVGNTVKALGLLANAYKKRVNIKTIAVTGSVGKTTTKEFIYVVASDQYKTHKTEGNYNNEIGLPLTELSLTPDDKVSVVEMGMSSFGEIESMSKIAEPDIAMITNIGTSHMENLGSRENICLAKMEIIKGMNPNGKLILNADEPLLFNQRNQHNYNLNTTYISIYNRAADFRAVNIRHTNNMVIYDLIYNMKAVTNIEVPALGQHNVYNSLFAYATGVLLGMTDEQIRRGIKNFKGAEMRQRIYEINGITVIDDCYNASPESMRAGIDVLCSVASQKGTRTAALLGDMRELGEYSRLMHDQLGLYVAQKKVDILFTYGVMAENIALAAIKKGVRAENVYVNLNVNDPKTTAEMIAHALVPGDVLLVKASRAVAAEKVIGFLRKIKNKK